MVTAHLAKSVESVAGNLNFDAQDVGLTSWRPSDELERLKGPTGISLPEKRRPKASIIVCTTRPEAYAALLASLKQQTVQTFELFTIRQRGPLNSLRNGGLSFANAPITCIIDDDTICPPRWLEGILATFAKHPEVVGVSGPAIITDAWRKNRHLFRYPWLSRLYRWAFLDHPDIPGHISRSGAPTTCSADADCRYEGYVDFLEACNMSWRTQPLRAIGGFDETFGDLGEWGEPDCAARLRPAGRCYFTPAASLFHQPARGGATLRRKRTQSRLQNVELFHRRWVAPSWRAAAYRGFLRLYFGALELGLVKP